MMNFQTKKRLAITFISLAILSVITLILWNTFVFFERLKQVERDKMEIWAQSQKAFISNQENDYLELNLLINTSNNKIPIINLNQKGTINLHANIPEKIVNDSIKFKAYLNKLKAENQPIEIKLPNGKKQYLYYGTSLILKKLKYYPMGITLVIILLCGVVYFFLATSRASEQNRLWAGMAKETAHQIGTPLSSLVGWTELLKAENVSQDYVLEMEKDIDRLKMITDRFSKIGSIPQLKEKDIVKIIKDYYEYIIPRTSKLVHISLETPNYPIIVNINELLFSWTIENLIKNAIDAMKGKGTIRIQLIDNNHQIQLLISDTGSGISKRNFKTIFEPGHTSKKRGWGLGLSLAKRIIVDYHKGQIFVRESELEVGTTFQINLKQV